MESQPIQPGKEEYLNSEKYEVRSWDLSRPDSLRFLITLVNQIRRSNEALQSDWGLEFHPVDNEQLICYSKQSADGANLVIMVVNLDPYNTQSGLVDLRLDLLKVSYDTPYQVHDLLTDAVYTWRGARNYVSLNPHSIPAHILHVR
jgi:starch synthase (maltosyl-transferring)